MRNLNLLVLRCRELERTKAFYTLFGLNFVKEQHAAGPEHYCATDDVGMFELYPADSGAADRTGSEAQPAVSSARPPNRNARPVISCSLASRLAAL